MFKIARMEDTEDLIYDNSGFSLNSAVFSRGRSCLTLRSGKELNDDEIKAFNDGVANDNMSKFYGFAYSADGSDRFAIFPRRPNQQPRTYDLFTAGGQLGSGRWGGTHTGHAHLDIPAGTIPDPAIKYGFSFTGNAGQYGWAGEESGNNIFYGWNVNSGYKVTLGVWAKNPGTAPIPLMLQMGKYVNQAPSGATFENQTFTIPADNTWRRYSATFDIKQDRPWCSFYLYTASNAPAGTLHCAGATAYLGGNDYNFIASINEIVGIDKAPGSAPEGSAGFPNYVGYAIAKTKPTDYASYKNWRKMEPNEDALSSFHDVYLGLSAKGWLIQFSTTDGHFITRGKRPSEGARIRHFIDGETKEHVYLIQGLTGQLFQVDRIVSDDKPMNTAGYDNFVIMSEKFGELYIGHIDLNRTESFANVLLTQQPSTIGLLTYSSDWNTKGDQKGIADEDYARPNPFNQYLENVLGDIPDNWNSESTGGQFTQLQKSQYYVACDFLIGHWV